MTAVTDKAVLVEERVARIGQLITEIDERHDEIHELIQSLVGESGKLLDWRDETDEPLLPNSFDVSGPLGLALFHAISSIWQEEVLGDLDDAVTQTAGAWRDVEALCKLAVEREQAVDEVCA